jgi:hypothetical protein
MKVVLFFLALLLSAALFSGVERAAAASLSEAQMLALTAGDDANMHAVQYGGGGGGGGGSDGGYRRRNYDDDDGGYRERRYRRNGRDYCGYCARRCSDGWCPPRCWGWRKECRRDRYYD